MSNVINSSGRLRQQLADIALGSKNFAGADFPVDSKKMYLEDGQLVPNRFATVNGNTGEILGIHSNSYKPLSHLEMILNQRGVIARSGLADGTIREAISLGRNGKKCYVKHTLPNHTVTTPDGDSAALTLLSINSFCGTWPFQISVGAHQAACDNGQVFTSGAASIYKSRHNRHLDIEHAADVITKAIPIFMEQSKLWHEWHGTGVNDFEAFWVFAEAVGSSTLKNILHAERYSLDSMMEMPEVRRSRNFMYMCDRYSSHYRKALGANLWGVYNTLTDWATHSRRGTSNPASIQVRRAKQIQGVLGSEGFGLYAA